MSHGQVLAMGLMVLGGFVGLPGLVAAGVGQGPDFIYLVPVVPLYIQSQETQGWRQAAQVRMNMVTWIWGQRGWPSSDHPIGKMRLFG